MLLAELMANAEVFIIRVKGSDGTALQVHDNKITPSRSATGTYSVALAPVAAPATWVEVWATPRTADRAVIVGAITKSGSTVTVPVTSRSTTEVVENVMSANVADDGTATTKTDTAITTAKDSTGNYTVTFPVTGAVGAQSVQVTPIDDDIVASIDTLGVTSGVLTVTVSTRTVAAEPADGDADFMITVIDTLTTQGAAAAADSDFSLFIVAHRGL
jgi:hypothetical protein